MQGDPRRRGFGHERHGALKLALSALAVAGFLTAWAGFAASHGESSALPPSPTPDTASNGTAIASVSGTPAEPKATATPRARTSRGS